MSRSSVSAHSTFIPADSDKPNRAATSQATVLVIVWARHEPQRVGELCVIPDDERSVWLGRGQGTPEEPNVLFVRQRPGALFPAEPLSTPSVSRQALELSSRQGALSIRRAGRAELTVNGVPTDDCELHEDDLIAVGPDLLLRCTRRPARIPPSRFLPPTWLGEFGSADEGGMVGETPAIHELRESVAFAGKAEKHVLLLGQSGTGKELAARAIHRLGCASGKFIARNASTLPASLIDAELFGNARNYPQAGMPERAGLIGDADGGTLFLDEIGELPNELQAHLLRVLDNGGEYQRLGESQVRTSSFRLVAATNRSIDALKHDFAARFEAIVHVPSLDERRDDIPLLTRALLLAVAEKTPEIMRRFVDQKVGGKAVPNLSRSLVQELVVRSYGTNIRELSTLLWQAMKDSEGDVLELPSDYESEWQPPPRARPTEPRARPTQLEPTLDAIRAALDANGGNVPAAARALGLSSRFVLNRLMKKHGIK